LQFWIYDRAILKVPYQDRYKMLLDALPNKSPLIMTETTLINDRAMIKKMHDIYVQDGFEGVILRKINGLYRFDYR